MIGSKVTIIGAGIGGLTTAIALRQHNLNYEIFEAVSQLNAAGAGIVLAPNAMKVYGKLGLDGEIIKRGNVLSELCITDHLHKMIRSNDVRNYGSPSVAISRTALQDILMLHIDKDSLKTGHYLRSIIKRGEVYTLHFSGNMQHDASLIIGADGIHSKVREHLLGEVMLRDTNQTCWRGMVKTDNRLFLTRATEMWGRGKRFGYVPLGEDDVYWFAPVNKNLVPAGEVSKEILMDIFSGFAPVVNELIEATPEDAIIRNDILDFIPLKLWYRRAIVLLGDAAHATTPNMGQGACQAIEDAWVLSGLLNKTTLPEATFYRYQGLRKPVTDYVTKTSYTFGKLAQWENKTAIRIRNFLVRKMPGKLIRSRLTKLYNVKY